MWIKYLVIIILFYFFAVLQNTFFVHFNLFGAVPNLVFIFFFLLVFFVPKKINYSVLFYAIIAGLFLDIFSYKYFGISIILLIIIAYITKKIQSSLKEKKSKDPFVYFFPTFLLGLLIYELSLMFYLRFLDPLRTPLGFGSIFLGGIIYNLIVASMGFFVFKKIYGKKV